MDSTSLLIGVFSGAIGLGYFVYGKKQRKAMPFLCGVGLIVLPYFISNNIVTVLVCLALTILPFVFQI